MRDDFFDRWAGASRSRPDTAAVPPCCWKRLEHILGSGINNVTTLCGGQSGYLAARVVTPDARFAIKGVLLTVAAGRDIERFAVEMAILRAGYGDEGIAQFVGMASCHWLMLATRWIDGEHLNRLHAAEIIDECLQIVDRIGDLIEGEDIPTIESSLRRHYDESLRILDTLEPCDAAAARTALTDDPVETRLIHGGLWPDNILVSRGRPILLDWGSAGLADPALDRANADLLRGQLSARRPVPPGGRGHLALRSISAAKVLETNAIRRLETTRSLMEAASG